MYLYSIGYVSRGGTIMCGSTQHLDCSGHFPVKTLRTKRSLSTFNKKLNKNKNRYLFISCEKLKITLTVIF